MVALSILSGCDQRSATHAPAPTETNITPWFENFAESAGVNFQLESGHDVEYYMPEITTGGAALFDMDRDGDLDIYLVQAGSVTSTIDNNPPNRLYRNEGDGTFTDITTGSGAEDTHYGTGVTAGDYDNDGDTDLYVTNLGRNTLLRNEGGGRFTDVTAAAGVGDTHWGQSAAFLDFDCDGHLDLFVSNYVIWSTDFDLECTDAKGKPDYCTPLSYDAPAPDVLYHNNGDGTFTDVSLPANLRSAFGNGLGVVCGDFIGDHHPEIFVANDQTPNQLWVNDGDGTFTDMAPRLGCAVDIHCVAKAGMGTTAMDVDDDGDLDIMVVNLQGETDSLFVNHGSYFADGTAMAGLAAHSRRYTRFGMALADFDNDGALDAYYANGRVYRHDTAAPPRSDDPYAEPNLLLRGAGQGTFVPATPSAGTADAPPHTSRGAAFGDIDNDGGIDIVVVNRDAQPYLLRNVVPQRGRWIMIRAVNEHGSDALGAHIQFDVGERTITRDVKAAYSYASSNDPRVHVGLGTAERIGNLTVRWPDGVMERFGDFDANQILSIRRGTGTAE